MNWQMLSDSKFVGDLGLTLIHSIWQIGVVAGMLYLLLRFIHPAAANIRYAVSVAAIFISLALPVATFISYSGSIAPGTRTLQTGHGSPDKTIDPDLESDITRSTPETSAGAEGQKGAGTVSAIVRSLAGLIGRDLSSIMPIIVGLWLLGIAIYALRMTGGIWQLHRFRTRALVPINGEWETRFATLCSRLGINRTIRLLSSGIVQTPIAIGMFKPVIIVPASVFLQISPSELETIIVHELIHIRRYDPFVTLMESLIEVLFFYHPGVRWISTQIRLEREFATDNTVLKVFDHSHVLYARALANLEELRPLTKQNMPRAISAANGGNLMQRIQRILKIKTEMKRANSAWSAGLAVVLISAVLSIVFLLNSSGQVNAQARATGRKVAIGFVSIPPLDRGDNPPKDSDATARMLIAKLSQYKIPAIGFITGSSISDGEKLRPVRANIVRLWRDADLEIGIGGYDHLWFSRTGYDEYAANAAKNISVTGPLFAEKNLPLRYYSYPYLNTGKSIEDHKRFEEWLGLHGISSVKYTIDNNEWMYSYAYDLARNDNDLNRMKEIRECFIDYMTRMFEHYEAYSNQMFGRDIAQTMVLTTSRLVADSADDLFGMIGKRGYTFISMDEAQADDAYKTPETFTGDSGTSWFERWAITKGSGLIDEPAVKGDIRKIWQDKKIVTGNTKKDL